MLHPPAPPTVGFTTTERELIRRKFGQHVGSCPLVGKGIFLRAWRGGPQAGEPKLPPPVKTMLKRGLLELRHEERRARAFLTATGLIALREFAVNRPYL
jgi:hypothetical protein